MLLKVATNSNFGGSMFWNRKLVVATIAILGLTAGMLLRPATLEAKARACEKDVCLLSLCWDDSFPYSHYGCDVLPGGGCRTYDCNEE